MENDNNEMRPEYDFKKITGGVRGKYYNAYRQGHTVKIHNADGSTTVQHFKLEDGAVMLDPERALMVNTQYAIRDTQYAKGE